MSDIFVSCYSQVMTAVRAFDLNQNSLAEGEYDDCEKTLAGDDAAAELRRDLDGFLGKSWRRRSCPPPVTFVFCMKS